MPWIIFEVRLHLLPCWSLLWPTFGSGSVCPLNSRIVESFLVYLHPFWDGLVRSEICLIHFTLTVVCNSCIYLYLFTLLIIGMLASGDLYGSILATGDLCGIGDTL